MDRKLYPSSFLSALLIAICLILTVPASTFITPIDHNYRKNIPKNNYRTRTSIRSCISNTSHIAWPVDDTDDYNDYDDGNGCWIQTQEEAMADAYDYLRENIMPFDVPNAESLGFRRDDVYYLDNCGYDHDDDDYYDRKEVGEAVKLQSQPQLETKKGRRGQQRKRKIGIKENNREYKLPDGLSNGIVNVTIHEAMNAKLRYDRAWTGSVPRDIYFEYVLNYANVNEPRNDWRTLLVKTTTSILNQSLLSANESATVEDVVKAVNRDLWIALGRTGGKGSSLVDPIIYQSGMTPLVYDPMSVISYGYGSCTGLSILLVDALRSVGVPARLVGTPAWNDDISNGNHNWLEVYSLIPSSNASGWRFLEPAYGDYGTDSADNLDRNPCKRWFCNSSKLGRKSKTKVYAARLNRNHEQGNIINPYPMAWDNGNADVPGEDRTKYYWDVCSLC